MSSTHQNHHPYDASHQSPFPSSTPKETRKPQSSLVRTVITSMIGNLFEFYDFALFGYFAPIIGSLFFPSTNATVQLISAFGVFAAGFVVRPLGGIIFGHIGDTFGRKKALVLAILLMAVPTALIGLLPAYDRLGMLAPAILVFLRMLQGISMGGNYSGSITFITEHTPPEKRGMMGGLAVASCLFGILMGSATAAVFSNIFSPQELHSFGWRIPFVLGIFICLVGFYMRRNVEESPEFLHEQERQKTHIYEEAERALPLKEVFKHHKKQLVCAVGATMLHDLSFYMLFVYMTTYLTSVLGINESLAFNINTLNLFIVSIVTMLSAHLSDRFGRKPILQLAAVLFVIATIPLMYAINTKVTVYIILSQMLLAVIVGMYFGPIPALMIEAFPVKIRYSACAMTTNISGPLFGGTAPMIVTFLIAQTGFNMVPAFYLTIVAVIAMFALRYIGGVKPS